MAGRLEEHNFTRLVYPLIFGGGCNEDNGIREEGKNNKSMTGSATNMEYKHLNSTQMHLKDKHIPTLKKNKIIFFVEQKWSRNFWWEAAGAKAIGLPGCGPGTRQR